MQKKAIKFLIIILFLSISFLAKTQDFNTFKDKLYWGGSFGMSFGAYTYIQVAPVLSYAVSDDFIVGLGLDYAYFKDTQYYPFVYEGSIWTPRLFARYFLLDNLFVHAEFQQMFFKDVYNISLNPNAWITDSRMYAGGGYRSWMGPNSYSFIMLLFDLERSDFYFGSNPIVQIGFAAGF